MLSERRAATSSLKGSTLVKILIASTLLLGLLIWVQLEYGWGNTLAKWSGVPGYIIVLGATATFASHLIRVLRVYFGYRQQLKVKFVPVLGVSLVHNTLSFLLPMRLGELALPLLSKQQLAIDLRYSTATLLLLRLFDLHVLITLLIVFAGHLWLAPATLIIVVIAMLASLPLMIFSLKAATARFTKLQFMLPLLRRRHVCITLYIMTSLLWGVKLFSFAWLSSLLGRLAIDHAWLATIIADASALSPITGFANAGTFELAFALPLVPLGYDTDTVLQVAVNLHIFIFIINIFAGIFGVLFLRKVPQTNQ